jgi:ubiquinone/menaquinone biosynthesis C-methylase UbiE
VTDAPRTTHPGTDAWLRRSTRPGTRALEVGCGPAQYRRAVRGRYVGLDITAQDYRPGLPRDPDVLGDAHHLPFRAGTFDLVFFSNAFYLFADPRQALREARRILRAAGHVAIFDYSRRTLERLADAHARSGLRETVAILTSADWARLLREGGWHDPQVRLSSGSLRARLVQLLMPRRLRDVWIDNSEFPILVTGTAP